MKHRLLKILPNLFLLFMCVACSVPQDPDSDKALITATKFFETLSAPDPDSKRQDEWGMKSFEIFGRGTIVSPTFLWGTSDWDVSSLMAGSPTIEKTADSPKVYVVTIPFWIKGQTPTGREIKSVREIRVVVEQNTTGSEWGAAKTMSSLRIYP